jgi:predicted amidohydrolase YtcJ
LNKGLNKGLNNRLNNALRNRFWAAQRFSAAITLPGVAALAAEVRRKLKTLTTVALWSLAVAQAQAPTPKADILFTHANVYTGVPGDSSFHEIQRVDSFAIQNGRILATGKSADLQKYKGPSTQVVDLAGHFVMPGFNDAHSHLSSGGFQQLEVNLTGAKTLEEFRQRIREKADQAKPGEWILGRGWDHTLWPVKELPSRWDLDEVSTKNPIFLARVDGHIAVANTKALQLASITVASKDPAGGKIDRWEGGEPTGILRETAQEAVRAVIPKPDHAYRRKAVEIALAEAARNGVTSAQDNSGWDDFQIYEELEKEGKLTLRISEWLNFNDPVDILKAHRAAHPANDPLLHTGMLKGFMDGSLGSRTAAMLAPYSDDPTNSGIPQYEQDKLNALTKDRLLAGFQIGFHAIGDRAVDMALTAFAEAVKTDKATKPDYRLRIEHAQVLAPAQFQRFKDLKVIASMQPSHLLTDMNWAQARIGEKRAEHSYAWAEMLKNNIPLAFGTDFPVESINPFRGLYAATTRRSEDGKKEYFPAQRIEMDDAIAAYTRTSAYAEFSEKEKGQLIPGQLADFIVLDRDITNATPAKLLETKVLRTVVGGKTVYEAK